ncbi:hypothetical protein BDQ17DRAFT_1420049 [Cyathus striatus]|nr:hypothetical protein BDQ17DRAFT_1420049 [Cyathus striatus]
MPFPSLPQEIFEEIISHLSDDRSSLQRCSLTSQFFYSFTFRQLFHTIDIHENSSNPYAPPLRLHRLCNVIRESPRSQTLLSAVKSLKISIVKPPPLGFDESYFIKYFDWVSSEQAQLALLLSRLVNLQFLSIYHYGLLVKSNPNYPADKLLEQIEQTVIYGKLVSLELHGIAIGTNAIKYCSETLQHLYMGSSTPVEPPRSSSTTIPLACSNGKAAKLKRLSFLMLEVDS